MPNRDGTGPMGTGPGRGRGVGQGRGGGGRRGWRRGAANVPEAAAAAASQDAPPQSELQMLQTQVEAASATLNQIRQRLDELAAEQAPTASPGKEPSSTDA
jgi:hypothetical protein